MEKTEQSETGEDIARRIPSPAAEMTSKHRRWRDRYRIRNPSHRGSDMGTCFRDGLPQLDA